MSQTISTYRPGAMVFTDGTCKSSPGPGGWTFILKHPASGLSKRASGGAHRATNALMEMRAVIRGLEALEAPSEVALFSDSDYVVSASNGWMARWKRFGWNKSLNAMVKVKNADLWQRLDQLLQQCHVITQWVKGHHGHTDDERCDQMVEAAAARTAATPPPPPPLAPLSPAESGLFAASGQEVNR